MEFPIVRHLQRYEYITECGYVTDKTVLDIGCGNAQGTALLVNFAKEAVGMDPRFVGKEGAVHVSTYACPGRTAGKIHLLPSRWEEVNVAKSQVGVVVAVEIIEHLVNPKEFLKFAATVGDHLFITTPLAKKTAPTDNSEHVTEYSKQSMQGMLKKEFNILKVTYQHADLRITDDAVANGSSLHKGHVVQMYWCQSKRRKR